MADLNHPKSTEPWQEDDPEDPLGFDMDDEEELFFDEEEMDEGLLELSEDIPSWRRIEMAREDRFLKEAMADFEDYDEFEDFRHEYTAEFSH
jgi:hypothetical protein